MVSFIRWSSSHRPPRLTDPGKRSGCLALLWGPAISKTPERAIRHSPEHLAPEGRRGPLARSAPEGRRGPLEHLAPEGRRDLPLSGVLRPATPPPLWQRPFHGSHGRRFCSLETSIFLLVVFLCPFGYFGYFERLVSQPLSEDACILVLAASSTSMLEPDRQDHAQATQRPTQSPTQACHWGVASPAIMCYHLLIHVPLLPSSAGRSRCGAALAQMGKPGNGDRFIVQLWRPAPAISAGGWSDARRTGSRGGVECARPE